MSKKPLKDPLFVIMGGYDFSPQVVAICDNEDSARGIRDAVRKEYHMHVQSWNSCIACRMSNFRVNEKMSFDGLVDELSDP